MTFSPRRVASALAIVSIVSFSISFVATGVSICPDVKSCAAAVSLTGYDFSSAPQQLNNSTSQSTQSVAIPSGSRSSSFPAGVEITALYTLVLAIILFVVMEFIQPHFLKKYIGRRKLSH